MANQGFQGANLGEADPVRNVFVVTVTVPSWFVLFAILIPDLAENCLVELLALCQGTAPNTTTVCRSGCTFKPRGTGLFSEFRPQRDNTIL